MKIRFSLKFYLKFYNDIILILLLTFTDFELSGQKVETEAIYVSAKFKEFNFINILEHIIYYLLICYYIVSCMSVYRHMRKNNKQFYQKILGIFFKKVVLGWLYSIQNDNNFSREDYAKQLI